MAVRIAPDPETLAPEPRAAFLSDDAIDILAFAADALDQGHAAALVTLVEIRGGAARAIGARTPHILWHHVLPNLLSPILVQGSFIFAYAILAEAGLSFLGVGVPPEIPTWGTMVAGSQQYAERAFWVVLFPGLAIILTALSLQLLGDGVRDMLDPKLKKAV